MRHVESQYGKALYAWAARRIDLPGAQFLIHIPNGGKRKLLEAVRMKAEGVRKGFPDYVLPWRVGRCPGLVLELKSPEGKVTKDQKFWLNHFGSQEWVSFAAWDWKDAADVIESYLKTGVATRGGRTIFFDGERPGSM